MSFDIAQFPLALDWKQDDYLGYSRLTNERNKGCIIVDLTNNTVIVCDTQEPSVSYINEMMTFRRERSLDTNTSLPERLLDAEMSAFYNNNANGDLFTDPFKVISKVEEGNVLSVIQVFYDSWEGRRKSGWVIFTNAEKLKQFHSALSNLPDEGQPETIEVHKARNTLQLLSGHAYGKWYEIYTAATWWQNVMVGNPSYDMDDTEYGQVFCSECNFKKSYMYWFLDLGDHMRSLHGVWSEHHEQHPTCDGNLK